MTVKSLVPLLLGIAGTAAGCTSGSEPQSVPDVRGQRLDVAEERLDDRGLAYEEVGGGAFGIVVRSNWRVCDQEPAPGRKASEVRLVVARTCPPRPEPERVVPDVVGDTVAAAEDELEGRELAYVEESLFGESPILKAVWRVCDQYPPAGERAREVRLVVARDCDEAPAAAPAAPVVPNVIGEDLDDAEDLLDASGIFYDERSYDEGGSVHVAPEVRPLWEVCDQDPYPGARSVRVDLYVARDCY